MHQTFSIIVPHSIKKNALKHVAIICIMKHWLYLLLWAFPLVLNLSIPFTGTLIYRHLEFPNGIDEDRYYLAETEARLLFNQTPAAINVKIHGIGYEYPNHTIAVDTYYIDHDSALENALYEAILPQNNIRMILFMLNICTFSVGSNTSTYNSLIFSGNTLNLNNYYQSCSLSTVNVLPEDSVLVGPVNVPCSGLTSWNTSFTINKCTESEILGWAQYAESYAAANGIDLSLYKHRVFIIPYRTVCGWLGLADVGCYGYCRSWLKGDPSGFSLQALFHELGHNHGLRHAGTPGSEYGDYTSAMGGCCGIRCHGAHQGHALGWYDPIIVLNDSTLSNHIIEIPSMLSTPSNHIQIQLNNSEPYFISYRTNAGYDMGLSSAGSIHVHNYYGTPTSRYVKSTLLAIIPPNTTWIEKKYGWTLRFIQRNNSQNSAIIHIAYHKNTCGKCGDKVCDPSAGENCLTCPKDCREDTTAAGRYYCCGLTHTCYFFRCNNTRRFACSYNCGPAPSPKIKKIVL